MPSCNLGLGAFLASFALTACAATAALPVPNASFEDALDGAAARADGWHVWTGGQGQTTTALVPNAAHGAWALQVANRGTKGANLTVRGSVPCTPGTTYTLSVSVRTRDEAVIAITLQALDASHNVLSHAVGGQQNLPRRIANWQRFTFTATTPPKAAFLSPHLINKSGTVLWDAVQIDAGPAAQPFNPAPRPTLVPADAATEGCLVPNPGFEQGADGWTPAPGAQLDKQIAQAGQSLRFDAGEITTAWRSDPFPLDPDRDYLLSAWVRSEGLNKGLAEFYVECLSPWGTVVGLIGKGPAYREAAGVLASQTQPWRRRTAYVGAEDVPHSAVAGQAVCSLRPYGKGGGSGWFDNVACTPATVTIRPRLIAAGQTQTDFLADAGQPVQLAFDLYAPSRAGRKAAFELIVRNYFGKQVHRSTQAAVLNTTGRTALAMDLGVLDTVGHFTASLALVEGARQVRKITFGIVPPELRTQTQQADSPYGICHQNNAWMVAQAQRVGFKWMRGGYLASWREVERTEGKFSFTRAEEWRRRMVDHGMLKLDVLSGIPDWAQRNVEGFVVIRGGRGRRTRGTTSLPRDLADWTRYAQTTAHQLAPFAGAWEVWNEADIPSYWLDTDENYLKLLNASYPALKAGAPRAPVLMTGITGGFAAPPITRVDKQSGREINNRRFLERVLSQGRDAFDVINFHSYGGLAALETRLKLMRYLATKHDLADRPIWITETGGPTHRGRRAFTEDEQARLYCQTHVLARAHGVAKIFWHCFYDWGRDITYSEHNYGLVHYDRSPKPALLVQAALARWFGRPRFVRELSLGDGIRTFAFAREGKPVTVVWATREQTVLVETQGSPSVRDLMGNLRPVPKLGRAAALAVGPDPVFVLDAGVTRPLAPLLDPATVTATPGTRERLRLEWHNPLDDLLQARVMFLAPPGWALSPTAYELNLKPGETATLSLDVRVPQSEPPGSTTVTASLHSRGAGLDLAAAHIRVSMAMAPARGLRLDGDLSDWSGPAVRVDRTRCALGRVDGDSDLSADVRWAWSPNGLWVAARVRDQLVSNPNRLTTTGVGDALEVFIGARQYVLVPPTPSYPRATWCLAQHPGPVDGPVAVAGRTTDDGYTLEALLPWPAGFEARTGSTVNVNLALDDLDEAAGAENVNADLRRKAQLVWSGGANGHRDAADFVPAALTGTAPPMQVPRLNLLVNGDANADLDADGALTLADGWIPIRAWGPDQGQCLWDRKIDGAGNAALAIRGVTKRLGWQSATYPAQVGVEGYRVTGRIRTRALPKSSAAAVTLAFFDSDGKWLGTPGVPGQPAATGTAGWTEFTFQVPAARVPKSAAQWRVVCLIREPAPQGCAWFDDLTVTTTR